MTLQIKTEIKDALLNPQLPEEFLFALADDYREASVALNDRLEKIGKLLIQGYRDEAIQDAEQVPNVLELFSQLDFPERSAWLNLLALKGLDLPPDLAASQATDLEEAYEILRQLEPKLKVHRKLALSHAPLSARIAMLRRLVKADPENPLWQVDCETLERARLVEIKTEFRTAKTKRDEAQIHNLKTELNEPWRIPLPKTLVQEVNQIERNRVGNQAREQLAGLSEQLNQCLTAYDDEAARPLRDQWNRLNATTQFDPQDPLLLATREALTWLAEMDQEQASNQDFTIALRRLETVVSDQVPLHELDRRIYEVQKFDRDIPDTLYHRVNQYRNDLILSGQRTVRLKYALVAGVVSVLVILTTWIILAQQSRRELANTRTQLESFIEEKAYESGLKFYQSLPTHVQKQGEFALLNEKLQSSLNQEQNRQAQFAGVLEQIRFDGSLGAEMEGALQSLKQLAANDTERNQVSILENKLNANRLTRQSERTQDFLFRLQPFRENLEQSMNQPGSSSSMRELNELKLEIQKLIDEHRHNVDGLSVITAAAEQTAVAFTNRAQLKIKEIEATNQSVAELKALPKQLDNFSRYANALQVYAQRFPSEPNADSFARSSREQAIWNHFRDMQTLATRIEPLELTTLSLTESKKWLNELKFLNQDLRIKSHHDQLEELMKFLGGKHNHPDTSTYMEKLTATFQRAVFSNLEVVQREGEQFYLAKALTEKKSDSQFNYFVENSRTQSTKLLKKDKHGTAPHCEIANRIREQLLRVRLVALEQLDIEVFCLGLLAELADVPAGELAVDPCVLVEFADQILLFTKLTAPGLEAFANATRDQIKQEQIIGIDWLAKGMLESEPRSKSAIFLGRLAKDVDDLKAELAARASKNTEWKSWIVIKNFEVVGFLFLDQENWLVDTVKEIPDGIDLYCLVPGKNNDYDMELVGNCRFGKLDNVKAVAAQAGRPVYLKLQ